MKQDSNYIMCHILEGFDTSLPISEEHIPLFHFIRIVSLLVSISLQSKYVVRLFNRGCSSLADKILKYTSLSNQEKILEIQTWNLPVILFYLKYREENSVLDLYLVFGSRKIHKLFKSKLESSFYTKAEQQWQGKNVLQKKKGKEACRGNECPKYSTSQSGSGLTGVYPCCNPDTLTGCSLLYINYTR